MSPSFKFRSTRIIRTYDVADAPLVKSEVTRWSILPDSVEVRVDDDGTPSVWIRGFEVDTDGTVTSQRGSEDFYSDSIPEWVRPYLDDLVDAASQEPGHRRDAENTVDERALRTAANPAIRAAADNDLYRVCGGSRPSEWRTRAGEPIDQHAAVVAVAGGILGQFQPRETLPDGTLVERLDLSNDGLAWYVAQTTR